MITTVANTRAYLPPPLFSLERSGTDNDAGRASGPHLWRSIESDGVLCQALRVLALNK